MAWASDKLGNLGQQVTGLEGFQTQPPLLPPAGLFGTAKAGAELLADNDGLRENNWRIKAQSPGKGKQERHNDAMPFRSVAKFSLQKPGVHSHFNYAHCDDCTLALGAV